MKKEILYYSILLIFISSLLFFETNLFNGNSHKYSKIIDVKSFEKLDIDLACNIYVSIGEEQKIVFEGPKKYLNLIEAKLENGILKISEKEVGIFAELFGTNNHDAESLNLYIKLTDVNQLLTPKKGNLISNETSLYLELECDEKLSLSDGLKEILKMLGSRQFGFIRIL
ncbi:MAG: DUF2807 domain-containing protein [Cyclobacteriaceae bacterium]|nr:DUF2807 domain-containing protein [Cyclobacteriaceae bacterium]